MSYDEMEGHTVLVGWRGATSDRLVDLLLTDTETDDEGIVAVAVELSENHRPEQMRPVAPRISQQPHDLRHAATRNRVSAPNTWSTLIRVMSVETRTSAGVRQGRQISGFDGPKITTTGRPNAAAICATP